MRERLPVAYRFQEPICSNNQGLELCEFLCRPLCFRVQRSGRTSPLSESTTTTTTRRPRYTQPRYTASVAYLRRTIHSTKLLGCTLEKSDSNLGIDSRYILLAKAFRILTSFLNSRSGIPSFRVIEQGEKYLRESILKSYFRRNRNLYVIIKW